MAFYGIFNFLYDNYFIAISDGAIFSQHCVLLLFILPAITFVSLLAYQRYIICKKSVNFYNQIIKNSSSVIFTVNNIGNIIFYNKSFLEISGYTPKELCKLKIEKIIPSFKDFFKHIQDKSAPDKTHEIEFIFLNKNGEEILLQATITLGEDKDNKPIYTFIARNITEKRKILNELIDSEQKFKAISENTPDAIFLLSKRKILYANPFACSVLGYSQEELQNKDFTDFIAEDYKNFFIKRFNNAIKSDRKHNLFRIYLLTKNGAERQVEISINTFLYKQKNAEIVIARDITEKSLLEQQLIQAEKLASLGQLVTGISHELNNKLQPIFIYCQLLKMNNFNEKIISQIEGIETSVNSAKIILESLLKFGRPGQLIKEKASINEVVRETLHLVEYKFKNQNIKLELHLDENLPLTYFDKNQISQVILNIINNAIYAIEKNKGDKLTIKTYKDKKMVILSIEDTGPGIPQEHLQKIFDPFFSTKPVGQGTGLGLSISYSIIKAHNGRIYATNKREGGTIFTIELPIYAANKLSG